MSMDSNTSNSHSIDDLLHMARHVGSGYGRREIASAVSRNIGLFNEQTALAHETYATAHRPNRKNSDKSLQYVPDVLLLAAHLRGERTMFSVELKRRNML